MPITPETVDQIRAAIDRDRLLDTAISLIEVPSPTREAKEGLDRLDSILTAEGLHVERPDADYPECPAVAARYQSGSPGRTLQFQGHMDTVHLPYFPPRVENGTIYGSGCSDMKGGIAAMVEAMRALRDTGLLPGGEILITSTDLHEAPWGEGEQIRGMVKAGYVGDGVLIPEYLHDCLPVVGRGMAVLDVRVRRQGIPVHEVLGGMEQPNVIHAGAALVRRLEELDRDLATRPSHPLGGRPSLFVGKIDSGEMFNQSPTEFRLEGTRRWLPGTDHTEVEQEFRSILSEIEARDGIAVDGTFMYLAPPFELDQAHSLVTEFQSAYAATTGAELPLGFKPVLDDGNNIARLSDAPPITHGPHALGAHTVDEEVPVDELVRVAIVYALTAIGFCGGGEA